MEEIEIKHLNNKWWEVAKDYSYGDITIPKGFKTDLASIPRILWTICPPFGNYTTAAIIHDNAYSVKYNTRKQADKEFRDNCIKLGVSKWKANLFYRTVRMFGGSHY